MHAFSAAQQAATALHEMGEQHWSVFYFTPTNRGFYFRSVVGGPGGNVAVRGIHDETDTL
eukprot:3078390-Amphidinium_carterae.1